MGEMGSPHMGKKRVVGILFGFWIFFGVFSKHYFWTHGRNGVATYGKTRLVGFFCGVFVGCVLVFLAQVWCEGARICLNPFSDCFNLDTATSFLDFAIEFTPQYGDSFIEYLRLQHLLGASEESVDRLWQLCINAEPNYGTLWFHCKGSVLHTTRQVLELATALIRAELAEWAHVYRCVFLSQRPPIFSPHVATPFLPYMSKKVMRFFGSFFCSFFHRAALERSRTEHFYTAAADAIKRALSEESANGEGEAGGARENGGGQALALPVGSPPADASDFVTGCVRLNRMHRRIAQLTDEERRALIYGGDVIVP